MKLSKFLTLCFLGIFFLLLSNHNSYALEIVKREDINIDETLSEQSDIYSLPQKIYISQLKGFNPDLNDNPAEWIQFLYYFSITRLSLNDIPYNYLIDKSGNIYEGAGGGMGVNPGLQGGENTLLIGIMDDSTALSPRAASSLASFVQELSYNYGIKEGNWELVDLSLVRNENALSYLTYTVSSNILRNSISTSLSNVEWSSTEHLSYKGSIVSVEYEKEVEIGKRLDVKVKIKNENDFIWFGDLTYIYISTVDSVESPYAINLEWESFSKPTHIKNMYIKPGGTGEITFQLAAKSRPNAYKESFYFMKSADNIIEGSQFDVEFTITKGSNKVVELVSPQYGFVNIRDCRWYSCKILEVANQGDVFITTDKQDGWYEILFNNGAKGWVYQKYAKEI